MILLVDEPGPKGVYKQSQTLGNEAAAYSLTLYVYYRPPPTDEGVSEHSQVLGRIRFSVLNFVTEPVNCMCK